MDNWLRPVFTRTKTPVIGPSTERSPSFCTDDNTESEDVWSSKIRPTSRVSSYIGFRPTTPPIPHPDAFPNLRNPDNIYHRPSGDQMTEMLKVVMMNQSCMDSVPIQYNSCILQVLEAYQALRMQLLGKEEAMDILRQSHTKDIKDFEDLATEWHQKEKDYQVEVKRLEVLLSMIGGGMESVSLARSKSLVHGSERASETISRGIGTIKARNALLQSQDKDMDSADSWQIDSDSRESSQDYAYRPTNASARFAPHQPTNGNFSAAGLELQINHSLDSIGSLQAYKSPVLRVQPTSQREFDRQGGSLRLLDALKEQQAEQEFGMTFESSTESGADSSFESFNSQLPVKCSQVFGLGILGKPLPDIPVSTNERTKQTTLDRFLDANQPNSLDSAEENADRYNMSFSFKPGDDADILAKRAVRDRAERKTLDQHLNHQTGYLNPSISRSEMPLGIQGPSRKPRGAVKPESNRGASVTERLPHLPRNHDYDKLNRADSSSSSIVTAVRDHSGRSSANGSQDNSQSGRRSLNHTDGTGRSSNDAVTAAARAVAASRKRSPRESNLWSDSNIDTDHDVEGKQKCNQE